MALVAVLVAVVILLLLGMSTLNMGRYSRVQAIRGVQEIAARCAADAGLEKSLYEMNAKIALGAWDASWLPSESGQSLGAEQSYDYSVSGDLVSGYTIQAVGTCGQITRTVSATLRLAGMFDYAMFVIGGVELKNGVAIDGYNYGAGDPLLQVGTAGTGAGDITLHNSALITGDVVVGVGGDPEIVISGKDDQVTGNSYAAPLVWDPLPITVPEYLSSAVSQGTITGGEVSSSGKSDKKSKKSIDSGSTITGGEVSSSGKSDKKSKKSIDSGSTSTGGEVSSSGKSDKKSKKSIDSGSTSTGGAVSSSGKSDKKSKKSIDSGSTSTGGAVISSSGKYDSIDISSGDTVTITAPVELYVTGDVDLGNSAEIIIDTSSNPDASLTLYLGGDYRGKTNSSINNLTADPHRLTIYGLPTCTSIELYCKGDFYGTIYAPYAEVEFKNAVEFYGSLVANSVILKQSSEFHYDASLRTVSITDMNVRFVVDRWSE